MKIEDIKEVVAMFEDSAISKMELEVDDFKLKLEKSHNHIHDPITTSLAHDHKHEEKRHASVDVVESHKDIEQERGIWIKSPIVGTYYASRATGSKPFVEINQRVKKGDILCIIEAMKVMNEIQAPCDGIVRSIVVTNESMVEYDQDLIRIGEE